MTNPTISFDSTQGDYIKIDWEHVETPIVSYYIEGNEVDEETWERSAK